MQVHNLIAEKINKSLHILILISLHILIFNMLILLKFN